MLSMIGWARRYEQRMASVGAGSGKQLLTQEANESVISAYLHACRQLTRQWATNIVFCEQQTMLKADEEAQLLAGKGYGSSPEGQRRGGGGGGLVRQERQTLTQGIIQMSEDGQELWFTEMHLDLFRIVHEHVELGIGTGIEVVLFNVLLACADFLVDVQNDVLAKCRSLWRSLGFVYLCALINNCRRCSELWEKVLQETREREDSPMRAGTPLADSLHMEFVNEGFVNLGYAAMQLAARRVLVQLERPLGALFAGGSTRHHPAEMAALVDHFLVLVRDGVAGSHATRTCAICLEQLYTAYGSMLFVQEHALTSTIPQMMAADIQVFEQLLNKHCAAGPFASRQKAVVKVRAASLIQLLRSLHGLLSLVLTPSVEEAAAEKPGKHGSHVDVPGLQRFVTQLFAQQPALTKELLTRLLHKCSKGIKALHGRKGAALVEACELAARSDPKNRRVGTAMKATVAVAKAGPQAVAGVAVGLARGVSQAAGLGESQKPRSISMGEASPMSAGSPGSAEATEDGMKACAQLFNVASEAVAMGKKGFTVVRLIEALGTHRRW